MILIYPEYYLTGYLEGSPQGRIYLGAAYLSSALKSSGHEMDFLHIVESPLREDIAEKVKSSNAHIVGFSSTTPMWDKTVQMARWIKADTGLPVIVGGAHPTLDPEGCLSEESVDLVCIGEGEEAVKELAERMESGRSIDCIESIWGKTEGKVFRNPVRHLIEDLDSLPMPDRSIYDMSLMAPDQHERITIMASRGCPYRCRYCSNHIQRSRYPNKEKYVRFRSVENVLAEIERVKRNLEGIDHVRFDDDILTLKRSWFDEFIEKYPKRIDLPFICNSRIDILDEERIKMLAGAGCKTICMGVESGSEYIRKRVLGRSMSDSKIIDVFHLCRKYGIGTVSLNMIGFPQENYGMILDTVKLNGKAMPGISQVTVFYPFPHTKLYEDCIELGLMPEGKADTLFTGNSSLLLEHVDPEQLEFISEYFIPLTYAYNRVFSLPRPAAAAGEKALDFVLSSKAVPGAIRDFIGGRVAKKTPWEWFLTTKY